MNWLSTYPSTLLQYQGINVQLQPLPVLGTAMKLTINSQYGKVKRRFPRKAKKWAKKNGVQLISVSGKRMWYSRTYGAF